MIERGPFKIVWLPAAPGYHAGFFRWARMPRRGWKVGGVVVGRVFLRWRNPRGRII